MIRCIIADCTWKSATFDRLYDHLKNYHGELTKYACNVDRCSRSYGIRSSFIRHFKTHFINTNNPNIPNSSMISNVEVADVTHTDQQHKCQLFDLDSKTETNPTNSIIRHEELSNIEINILTDNMSKLNLEMSLKWLNMNSMPRKTVFELQKDLQDKVFTPFQQIFNTLESTGLITQAGKKILDNMVDCFITDDTEYKFKQKLEELDLYANAREFVISNQLQPGVVHNEQQMENDPITGTLEYNNVK